VLGRGCVELLGPGDVLRPWRWDGSGSHVHAEVGWAVLEPTCLAVLDHQLVLRMNPWPQLGLELFARGTRRAHGLAVALAIAHHPRVEDRLLLTLWHLGERWGRVGPKGIVVALALPHQRLADLVGSHRPSVTKAMGELVRMGALSRRDDGAWRLHGSPPEMRHHRLVAAMI
jgi:CRP/FNR family cyclic AMP-dependent transcriptional regulator